MPSSLSQLYRAAAINEYLSSSMNYPVFISHFPLPAFPETCPLQPERKKRAPMVYLSANEYYSQWDVTNLADYFEDTNASILNLTPSPWLFFTDSITVKTNLDTSTFYFYHEIAWFWPQYENKITTRNISRLSLAAAAADDWVLAVSK